jgi:dihydrofolate reductase
MSEPESFDPRAFNAAHEIGMIVACSRNGVIGRDGDLPWHLPEDLRHFMRSTRGCPVIMGRKTFDSLDKPLPNRLNIVLSRSMPDPGLDGVVVAGGLDQAIDLAQRSIDEGRQERPVWIAGGGTIYRQAMDRADLIVRTLIECEIDGDAEFPQIDTDAWHLEHSIDHAADDRHDHAFSFQWWVRR